MSYALVNLARSLVGWVRGGLGMSVVLAEYFFSGISGSTIANVSAIGSMLTPPMLRAGYRPSTRPRWWRRPPPWASSSRRPPS